MHFRPGARLTTWRRAIYFKSSGHLPQGRDLARRRLDDGEQVSGPSVECVPLLLVKAVQIIVRAQDPVDGVRGTARRCAARCSSVERAVRNARLQSCSVHGSMGWPPLISVMRAIEPQLDRGVIIERPGAARGEDIAAGELWQ